MPPLKMVFGALGIYLNNYYNYECGFSFFTGSIFTTLGSIPLALAYIGVIVLLSKGAYKSALNKWMAPVGRMAFTNYIMQSVICTFIFYGHGLAWFETLSRLELWYIIIPIWVFQILLSNWWLNKYKFGPLEWLWRSLSYWKIQDFKKEVV